MKKDRVFFQTGLFEKPFLNSRITTASMTMKEKILGYLVGPVGILALVAIVNQLLELYYTEVFYIDEIFGAGNYLLMSWVTKAVGIVAGLLIAYVVEHNVSSQGRIRPMVLIGCLFSAVSSFFLFYIPDMANWAKLAWVYVFNILFNGFGSALLALRVNLFTLCTRNQNDRNLVNLFEKVSSYLLVGTAVTLTVGSVLYYTMLHGHPAENWYGLVGIAALASIPLSLVHYYYTKERVTLAVIWCVLNLFTGMFAGVYETGLNMSGYQSSLGATQPESVANWLYFIRYVVPIAEYALIIVILYFMNLEEKLPMMQQTIRQRHKEAAEARGEVWVSPEELAEQEKAENARLAEEARIADLKEKCRKKGLDFDTENKKYLSKKMAKRK